MPDANPEPAVSLVMPCYNEEECLRRTATELIQAFDERNVSLQLVLVDNGSRDRTGQIIDELVAEGKPVTKVTVKDNIGYSNGVLQGLRQCSAHLVGFLCADGQVSAADTYIACEKARTARSSVLVKVRRRFRKDSWRRKLVSVIYNVMMQFIFGWLGSIDLNGNPKILRRQDLLAMDLQSKDWFLDPEIMIKARHLRLKILEDDVEGELRQGGKSNVRYVTCLEFLKNILRYRFGDSLREWKRTVKRASELAVEKSAGAAARTPGSSQ